MGAKVYFGYYNVIITAYQSNTGSLKTSYASDCVKEDVTRNRLTIPGQGQRRSWHKPRYFSWNCFLSVLFNLRGKESFISSPHLNSRWADTEIFQKSECVGKSLGRSSNVMYIIDVDNSKCRTWGKQS